jgi:hypothetical protein
MLAATAANSHARIAGMWMYVSALLSGTAEPFWPHFVLISGSVLAGIAVGAGIIFESSEYSASVHRVAKWLVIVGVVVESLCTVCLFVFDEAISSTQQATIRDQQAEIIRLTTPRNLSPAAVKRVESKVCPFGPKEFDIVFVTMDEILFGNELQQIWAACGWSSKGVQDDKAIAVAAASEVAGLHFLYDPGHADEFKGAAEAFASALKDENIAADAGPIPKDIPLSTNIIHIQLGRRP